MRRKVKRFAIFLTISSQLRNYMKLILLIFISFHKPKVHLFISDNNVVKKYNLPMGIYTSPAISNLTMNKFKSKLVQFPSAIIIE